MEPGVHVAVLAERGCVLLSERKVRIARVYAGFWLDVSAVGGSLRILD